MSSMCETTCQQPFRFGEETGGRIDRIVAELMGRRVLVVGLGESGHAAASFLLSRGAKVRCTDAACNARTEQRRRELEGLGGEVELGGHTEEFCRGCEMVVVSPGVDGSVLPLTWADATGVPVVSEMELGFRFCRSRVVGITGTNGKTTTCELTHEILKEAGVKAATAGNIGLPLVRKAAEKDVPEVLVVEVSSFQLERIHTFRPFISVILNITEDHLDRYDSFPEYVGAKRRIAENQREGDFLIVNEQARDLFLNDAGSRSQTILSLGRSAGADLSFGQGKVISRVSGGEKCYDVASRWNLRGEHNLENVAAAVGIAEILGVGEEAIYRALSRFRGLAHRIEFVDEVDGISFFDDSKGTNVDAAVRAVESFAGSVILIAGGRDKGGDYGPLKEVAARKVKLAIVIGEAAERITSELDGATPIVLAHSMKEAVELAFRNAKGGDVVLLSPACSSFDMFADYKERGQVFQRIVKELKDQQEERRKRDEAA